MTENFCTTDPLMNIFETGSKKPPFAKMRGLMNQKNQKSVTKIKLLPNIFYEV